MRVSGLHRATQMNAEHGKKTVRGVMQTDSKLSSTNYTFRLAVALTLFNFQQTCSKDYLTLKLRGSPASGRVPLERRVGPCALSTKRRTQHTKKAVNDKLPLHQITEITNFNKTFRLHQTKNLKREFKHTGYFKTKDRKLNNYRRAQRGAKGLRAFAQSRLSVGLEGC